MSFLLPYKCLSKQTACLLALFLLLGACIAEAAPQKLPGVWYEAPPAWTYAGQSGLDNAGLKQVDKLAPTGGRFWRQTEFAVSRPGRYVLDFKNSSVIGLFRHFVFDSNGVLVAELHGGIQSRAENPFFLRHGRELELPPGRYRLLTELNSPFFLAEPEPYLDTLADYRQAINSSNALVLACLGIFLGLGIYYAALALVRKRQAEAMYALFILGNLLYNGTALLVYPQVFSMHWFYLISVPILFSNCAYILFVMALLELRPATHPRLYKTGMALLALLSGFILLAALQPHWSLELDRYGVGIFLAFGLTAGIIRARQGNVSAQLYLVAVGIFFILGVAAISQAQLNGLYTIYIEHIGLLAVAVEVILLALVLSYQFAQLRKERDNALTRLAQSNRIAHTDALTGLSNRYALDAELELLPPNASMTFIDLDGLKYYNDRFGHACGDELLCSFSHYLTTCLGDKATLYRMGGDEFAITCAQGDLKWVGQMLAETVTIMHASGFEFAGASAGSVYIHESPNKGELKHMADTRMYENKRMRKVSPPGG